MDPNDRISLTLLSSDWGPSCPWNVMLSFNKNLGKWLNSKKWMTLNIFGKNNVLRRSINLRLPVPFSETRIKYWHRSLFGQYWFGWGAFPSSSSSYSTTALSVWPWLPCVSLHFTNLYTHECKAFKQTDSLQFYLLPKSLLLSCWLSYYDSNI